MTILRWLVGLAALAICIAGGGWYAVYLFAPDPRTAAGRRPAITTSAKPLTPYERRQNKRTVVLGAAAAIGGLVLTVQALDSIRTGIPIQALNESPMNGWVALAAALFIIVLGLWLAGAGLGLIRARNSTTGR
jgi:hypothetical protein